jgi:CRISPR/Cas system CMR-associated protein Cmr5 small subunit
MNKEKLKIANELSNKIDNLKEQLNKVAELTTNEEMKFPDVIKTNFEAATVVFWDSKSDNQKDCDLGYITKEAQREILDFIFIKMTEELNAASREFLKL